MQTQRKGFTLIELLVVIAIVAILSVVVVLALNPAQLLAQARDSSRISDLATYKSALGLYLADVASPDLDGSAQNCSAHASSTFGPNCNSVVGPAARFTNTGAVTTSTGISVGGTGWIPVNFNLISSGSPISALPIDPVNNSTYYYAYRADQTALTYEINANMESTKFAANEATDGGNSDVLYEVGTDPGLDL